MYTGSMKAEAFKCIVSKHASRQLLASKLTPNYVNLCFFNFVKCMALSLEGSYSSCWTVSGLFVVDGLSQGDVQLQWVE